MNCCDSNNCRCKFRENDETCGYCDYEEEEEEKLAKARLHALGAAVMSKKEWVVRYLQMKPDADVAEMTFDYCMAEGLKERFGSFSLHEAFDMYDACQPKPPSEKPT
jgi:hypothetical protein